MVALVYSPLAGLLYDVEGEAREIRLDAEDSLRLRQAKSADHQD